MSNPRYKAQPKPKSNATKRPSRLAELVGKVRSQLPAAALPCNLSDELLELIGIDLEEMLSETKPQDSGGGLEAQALGLVLHILAGQPDDQKPGILLADLFAAVEDYQLEIKMELKCRRTGIHSLPATMETIFRRSDASDGKH